MLDKYEMIKQYMKSRIGATIVEMCCPEAEAISGSVESASTRYWTAMPYQSTDSFSFSMMSQESIRSVQQLKTNKFGSTPYLDDVYFIGLGRYEVSGLNNSYGVQSNYFDQKLLGRNFGYNSSNSLHVQDPRYLADRMLHHASTEDLLFGELDYRYDLLTDELIFITPPIEGVVTLWLNWGFCPTRTIELVPMMHFDLFKKMVTFEFLETIIAARTGITLSNADFQMDVSDLISKRDALKEELEKEIKETTIITGVWG
jgi:hypothetical protein